MLKLTVAALLAAYQRCRLDAETRVAFPCCRPSSRSCVMSIYRPFYA